MRQTDLVLIPIVQENDGFPRFGLPQSTGSPHPPLWRSLGRHSHHVHAQVPSYGAPWFQLLSCCCPLLASDHMLCSCTVHFPLSRGTIPASQPSLPRVRDWSVVLTSTEPRLIACHCSVIASHPPDTPGRAPVLESLTQILCDGASLVAAPRSAAAPVCPRRRQPRRWNEDCFPYLWFLA